VFVIKYQYWYKNDIWRNGIFKCKRGSAEFLKYLKDNKVLYYKIISVENNMIAENVKRIVELETSQSFFKE